MQRHVLRPALAVAALVLASTLAAASEVRKEETRRFKLPRRGRLVLSMRDGSVSVRTWNRNEAELRISMQAWGPSRRRAAERLEEVEVATRTFGSELRVTVRDHGRGEGLRFWDLFDPDTWDRARTRAEVNFQIVVPPETALEMEADDADISVRDLEGRVEIDLDDGEIELQNIDSEGIRIAVDDASVDLFRVQVSRGRASLRGDDGRIRVEESRIADLEGETDDGDIALIGVQAEAVDLGTDRGDIELDLDPVGRADVSAVSDAGDVILSLPEDVDCRLELETEHGRIRSDFDIRIEDTRLGSRVDDRIGRGRMRIRAYTEDGDIVLERQ